MRCICGERLALEVYTTEGCAAELIARCSKCNPEAAEEKETLDSVAKPEPDDSAVRLMRALELDQVRILVQNHAIWRAIAWRMDLIMGWAIFMVACIITLTIVNYAYSIPILEQKVVGGSLVSVGLFGAGLCLWAIFSFKHSEVIDRAEEDLWGNRPTLKADWEVCSRIDSRLAERRES